MVRTAISHLFHTPGHPGHEELATRLSGDYRDRTLTG